MAVRLRFSSSDRVAETARGAGRGARRRTSRRPGRFRSRRPRGHLTSDWPSAPTAVTAPTNAGVELGAASATAGSARRPAALRACASGGVVRGGSPRLQCDGRQTSAPAVEHGAPRWHAATAYGCESRALALRARWAPFPAPLPEVLLTAKWRPSRVPFLPPLRGTPGPAGFTRSPDTALHRQQVRYAGLPNHGIAGADHTAWQRSTCDHSCWTAVRMTS